MTTKNKILIFLSSGPAQYPEIVNDIKEEIQTTFDLLNELFNKDLIEFFWVKPTSYQGRRIKFYRLTLKGKIEVSGILNDSHGTKAI